jgi:hypothetical protein
VISESQKLAPSLPQDVLVALQVNAHDDVYGPGFDLAVLADLEVDGVHEDDGIDCRQRPMLPDLHGFDHLVGDLADCGR